MGAIPATLSNRFARGLPEGTFHPPERSGDAILRQLFPTPGSDGVGELPRVGKHLHARG